jgi:hypothetical protein
MIEHHSVRFEMLKIRRLRLKDKREAFALTLQDGSDWRFVPMDFGNGMIEQPLFLTRKALVEALEATGFCVHDDDSVEILDSVSLVAPQTH